MPEQCPLRPGLVVNRRPSLETMDWNEAISDSCRNCLGTKLNLRFVSTESTTADLTYFYTKEIERAEKTLDEGIGRTGLVSRQAIFKAGLRLYGADSEPVVEFIQTETFDCLVQD
ncbi:hypothetical protein H7Y63_02105 [Polaromonas sp.]|nr:hypothetical protein [Candidatus Saccharibacteria bacterium]